MIARLLLTLALASASATAAVVAIRQPDPPKAKPVMLTAAAPLVPRPVQTETYVRPPPARVVLAAPIAVAKVEPVPEPPVPPAMVPPRAEPEPKAKRERRAQREAGGEDNICARHKLRKVWVSDRKWRCRK